MSFQANLLASTDKKETVSLGRCLGHLIFKKVQHVQHTQEVSDHTVNEQYKNYDMQRVFDTVIWKASEMSVM